LSQEFVRVADSRLLREGEAVTVDANGREVLLARAAGRVYAVSNLCSHAEGWLEFGTVHVASCEIECPLHQGRFDLQTGAATAEPCIDPIPAYVAYEDDDGIYVETRSGDDA
jgi:nitrite reductase/ring-hydroxylating ferredoxin subunit